ncbi:MAG TPA: phytanoyl-CoA dioxygenase family protein [Planctomycetota bacterium]|nr:phytanoyl-CoA dioxygenase family protein [Planctomycetota bacterium]
MQDPTSPAAAPTAHERYLFDLQGYLVVPGVLDARELATLNGILDERIAAEVPPDAKAHRFFHRSGALLSWGAPYRALIDHARIMPYLDAFVGEHVRLDHDYCDIMRGGHSPIGASLHGGATPYDPQMAYAHHNGSIRCGLVVVAFNLHDVNPGDGGFAAVPGSHKANLPFPHEWADLETVHPCVTRVVAPAGSAIIFTEAMTHGPLPWSARHERRTLFYKYSPAGMSWAAHYYRSEDYADLTPRQRALLEPPNARYPGRLATAK